MNSGHMINGITKKKLSTNLNLKKTISPTTFSSEVNRKLESLYHIIKMVTSGADRPVGHVGQ